MPPKGFQSILSALEPKIRVFHQNFELTKSGPCTEKIEKVLWGSFQWPTMQTGPFQCLQKFALGGTPPSPPIIGNSLSLVPLAVITNSYLAVLIVNSQWTPKRTVAAYFVEHRNSAEELETFHPIHPSMLESREPIIPPPSFADFGECVLDTSRRAMFDGVYEGELDSRNLIPPECLGSFPTQRWLDMDLEFKLRDEKHEEEKRCEELEARRIGADYDKWTNFSCRSTVAVPLPHTFTAPNDIKVVVSYDLSAVRQLVPASQFFEEELKIKRSCAFLYCAE
ncbi:hypothetical protein FB45DRAFT_858650 [Roridomyces roridus]|uniref:Uncharacterized protein n=1 Tax=Roridomyces roridus TaxID=1738132 RepID=A0AAD7CHQ1_9AGAR|nr:hypothetical protein FB45DRAFT_858650 [Roridomyces roridus]